MEITESVFIEDIQKLLPLFHEIRKMGISLSLNDFGTGYSSLSLLEILPLNELKVDKTFVDRLLVSSNKQSIASAIIKIAHNVGTFSLAEGVETKEQLDFLLNHEVKLSKDITSPNRYLLQSWKITLIITPLTSQCLQLAAPQPDRFFDTL